MTQSEKNPMVEISDMDQNLPPELLTNIFRFLPYSDLKNAILVCRCAIASATSIKATIPV